MSKPQKEWEFLQSDWDPTPSESPGFVRSTALITRHGGNREAELNTCDGRVHAVAGITGLMNGGS